uniref:HTH CENPB-type domain-containing protein n=1 Tax=Latimeria chalumnae TaxID=7897 RepID=H3AVG9_LATCH
SKMPPKAIKMPGSYRRNELTLKEKVKLIRESEKTGKPHRELAMEFGIGKTQVGAILKKKRTYLDEWGKNANSDAKRLCIRSPYEEVNVLTWQWYQRARAPNLPISGPLIAEQALKFAASLGLSTFKASDGWLSNFKKKHKLTGAVASGESVDVDKDTCDDWLARLPDITQGYQPRDIFNLDETGVFYRALPDRSLAPTEEERDGSRHCKDRLTACLLVNQCGEFEKTLVIGRSAKPRCFRNIKLEDLPVVYKHNKKACMTNDIYNDYLTAFDKRMERQERQVLLFLDRTPSHTRLKLKNTKVMFLPANRMSLLQPLNQGIIQNIKQHYRKRMLRYLLTQINDSPPNSTNAATDLAKDIDIHNAIIWLYYAVKDVLPTAVTKCFAKAGFPTAPDETLVTDDDDDSELQGVLTEVVEKLQLPEPMTARDYLEVDADTPQSEGLSTGWESQLLEDFVDDRSGSPTVESESETEEEGEPQKTSYKSHQEVLTALRDLQVWAMEKGLTEVLTHFTAAEDLIQKDSIQ